MKQLAYRSNKFQFFNMEFVSSFVSKPISRKPSIQPKTRIDRVKMAPLSVSGTKCYFSHAGQGRQQLIPINSWVYSIKKHLRDVNVFFINLTSHANNRRRLNRKRCRFTCSRIKKIYDRSKQISIEICRLFWNCYLADSMNNALE